MAFFTISFFCCLGGEIVNELVDILVHLAGHSDVTTSSISDLPADLGMPIAQSSRNSDEMDSESEDSTDLGSFVVPTQIEESSIADNSPGAYEIGEIPAVTTYEVIKDGSQKGKEKLADSNGYTYTVKTRRANGNKVWTCSVRNKTTWCKASVQQKGSEFTRGVHPHIHSAQLGAATAIRVVSAVKRIAEAEIFTSAAEIVNKVSYLNLSHILMMTDLTTSRPLNSHWKL